MLEESINLKIIISVIISEEGDYMTSPTVCLKDQKTSQNRFTDAPRPPY